MSAHFTPTSIIGKLSFLTGVGVGTCQYAVPTSGGFSLS